MTSYADTTAPGKSERDNNFDLLRFIFAFFVLYAHSFPLGGFGIEPVENYFNRQETFGSLGVMGFFVISGYLVSQSLIYSKSLITFGVKRFLRLYPGFWANLIITAFVFAPFAFFLEKRSLRGFSIFAAGGPVDYLKQNYTTLMHDYSISGLLSGNPYRFAFNGSLWTLFLEVKAYIILGIIGLVGLRWKKVIVPFIYLALSLLVIFDVSIQSADNKFIRLILDPAFLMYLTYFFAGCTYYFYKEVIPLSKPLFYINLFATIVSAYAGALHEFLPISAPYLIIWLAFNLPKYKFSILGRYSYGLYIYAFPIQQLVTLLGFNSNVLLYIAICFLATLVFALFSWYVVESPASSTGKSLLAKKKLTFPFKN